ATSNDGIAVTYNASANDLVDGSVAVDCAPASGSTFAVGTTTVDCSASDSRNNTATGSFEVAVTSPNDPPPDDELNLPDDITAEATSAGGAVVTFSATSGNGNGEGDDENGRPNGGGNPVTCAPASGSLFPLGTTTVQCSAGNASGTFLVHVVDTTAPALTLPADILTDATTVTWTATASDAVDGDVVVTCTPPSGSTFPIGISTVNCSASDSHANAASGSFSVTVTQQPGGRTISLSVSPDKLWPPDHKMVQVTITATASDNTPVTAEIVAVASSENDPDDNTSPDWIVTGPLTLELRAEKSAQAKVRVYTIDVKITDEDNNLYLERATVTVTNANASSTSLTRSPRG
ncbi:MAG TPA: HYR domain-containing protein, partial [Thermoanaerobaculia bacterium]|nr:HYR domain-containing protein [Thermoanaerobaculia bacterium]